MDVIRRVALGQVAQPGAFYNAHTDCFCEKQSFFKGPLPESLLEATEEPLEKHEVVYADSFPDRCCHLGVTGYQKLSITALNVPVGGCGEYLNKNSPHAHFPAASLVYRRRTIIEKVKLFSNGIKEYVSEQNDAEATHIVTELEWGLVAVLTLLNRAENEASNLQAKSASAVTLKRLLRDLTNNNKSVPSSEPSLGARTQLEIFVDDISPQWQKPHTITEFTSFLQQVPYILKSNDGKVRPIAYAMVSLSWIRAAFSPSFRALPLPSTKDKLMEAKKINFLVKKFYEHMHILHQYRAEMMLHSDAFDDSRRSTVEKSLSELESKAEALHKNIVAAVTSLRKNELDNGEAERRFDMMEMKLVSERETCEKIREAASKLTTIWQMRDEGIEIITSSEALEKILAEEEEVYVFFSNLALTDSASLACRLEVRQFFSPKQYVVVDLDVVKTNVANNSVHHYEHKKCVEKEVMKVTRLLQKNSLIRFVAKRTRSFKHPELSVRARISCPKCTHGKDIQIQKRDWICYFCETYLEYGFNDRFYCACGESQLAAATWRCQDPGHGSSFTPYPLPELQAQLKEIKPPKRYNILVIGETGCGKATFLNSLYSYTKYNTFEEARKHSFPFSYSFSFVTDSQKIKFEFSENEVVDGKQDLIQSVRSRRLSYNSCDFWICDLTGIGEKRGYLANEECVEMIMRKLHDWGELSAVCVVIPADSSKLHNDMKDCLTMLLCRLQADAANNVVFCFTKSRQTWYRDGQALTVLDNFLETLHYRNEVVVPLTTLTKYYFDNEAFKLLAAMNKKIKFSDAEINDYKRSWEVSAVEARRLLRRVTELVPFSTKGLLPEKSSCTTM